MKNMMIKGAGVALALGLLSPALTACGGDSKADDKKNAGATASSSTGTQGDTGGADTNGGAEPSGGSSPKPKGSLKAVKLAVPEDLHGALEDTYFAAQKKTYPKGKRENVTAPAHVLFGKVTGGNGGVEFYAVADIGFKDIPMSSQDGPHVWKKDDSQNAWAYAGDTGGALCGKVPTALVKAWGKPCN